MRVGWVTSTCFRSSFGDMRTFSGPILTVSSGTLPGQTSTTRGFLSPAPASATQNNRIETVAAICFMVAPLLLLVQIEAGVAADQGEHMPDLFEAEAEEEVGIAAEALGAEDEEIGLGILQGFRTGAGQLQAIVTFLALKRGGQLHRTFRGIARLNLQLPVYSPIGGVTDVGDDALHLEGARLAGTASAHLEAPLLALKLDRLDHALGMKF